MWNALCMMFPEGCGHPNKVGQVRATADEWSQHRHKFTAHTQRFVLRINSVCMSDMKGERSQSTSSWPPNAHSWSWARSKSGAQNPSHISHTGGREACTARGGEGVLRCRRLHQK